MPGDRGGAPGAVVLEVQGLAVRYGDREALSGVSFQVAAGERMAVVGPNGAGKTTLFEVVAGLRPASAGSVTVHGHAPGADVCVAYVQQRTAVDWSFPVSVRDVVAMGRAGRIGMMRRPAERDRRLVDEALATVGLERLGGRQIGALSGGEQQRMFLARALAQEAELVLMDEPLTGLDAPSSRDVLDALDALRASRVAVLVATHDLDLAATSFDSVLLLAGRPIALGPPAEVLAEENLLAAYGGRVRLIDPGHGAPRGWTAGTPER